MTAAFLFVKDDYPVLIKIDRSSGGRGTYECRGAEDIQRLHALFDGQQLLLQKEIAGQEIDVSAIYKDGQLIHCNYAIVERAVSLFGPSSLRKYVPLHSVTKDFIGEIRCMGRILGADGFVNMTCMQTADGKRYYFEADMRPNAWIDSTTFFGDDPAPKIRRWFSDGVAPTDEDIQIKQNPLKDMRIPYFLRLSNFELLTNRYNVWCFIPWCDTQLVLHLLIEKLLAKYEFRRKYKALVGFVFEYGRFCVPKRCRASVKSGLFRLGICPN